jgi:hypothetical protein
MDLNIYSIPNGLNPPLSLPSSENADEVDAERLGRRLMALVRTVDKTCVNQDKLGELRSLLRGMLEIFSRKGLLQGDAKKAEKILASGSQSSNISGGGRKDKKGKSKRNSDDIRVINEVDLSEKSGVPSMIDDEQLILAGLSRLLGGTQELSLRRILKEGPDVLSIRLAAQVCSAITQHVRLFLSENSCALAEYELLTGCGRNFLTGVARTTNALLCSSNALPCDKAKTLEACLASATSLVSLFGTKLARSSPVIESLRAVGWQAICQPNEKVQQSAARLLSALTLTGVDSVAPAEAWTKAISDGISASVVLIKAVAPVKSKVPPIDPRLSEKMNTTIGHWIDQIRETLPDEATRVAQFRASVGGLVRYIVALFQREFADFQNRKALNASFLPMNELLDLLECLLSYPSLAESAYYGTKKRLRFEAIQEGVLSPYAMVTDVANFVKSMGQTLFQVVLDGLGRPSLLQYGKHLTALGHASLQNACSTVLWKALDPAITIRLDGTRKRWLNQSVSLRAKGVQNARSIIVGLGSNMVMETSNNAHTRSRSSNGGGKMILLVAGCAIEQIGWDGKDDDWGRLNERVELAANAMDYLAACLDSCGGYLPFKMRSLIDSTALTCLNQYAGKSTSKISSWSQTKIASLNLGIRCICTPWPDSAMSELTTTVRGIAQLLASDSDLCVSALARHCLQVCNLSYSHRAPPLSIATRFTPGGGTERSVEFESASAIVESLDVAKSEFAKEAGKPKPKPKRKSKESKDEIQNKKKSKFYTLSPLLKVDPLSLEGTDHKTPVELQADVDNSETVSEEELMQHTEASNNTNALQYAVDDVDVGEDDGDDFMPGIVDCGPDGDDDGDED